MNKEKAYSYVLYGIESTKFSPKMCMAMVPFNLIISAIAIALFHNIIFIILNVIYVCGAFITALIFRVKWNINRGFLSQGSQLLIFIISIDLLDFGMNKRFKLFSYKEYIIVISIQVVAFLISLILTVKLANKHNEQKKGKVNVIAGSIAALFCVLTSVFAKLFLTNVSESVVITILSILINLIVYLLSFAVIMAFYRYHLIKKYSLIFNQREIVTDMD